MLRPVVFALGAGVWVGGCDLKSSSPPTPAPGAAPLESLPTPGHTITEGQSAERVEYVCAATISHPAATITGRGFMNTVGGQLYFVPSTWRFFGVAAGANATPKALPLAQAQSLEEGGRRGVQFSLNLEALGPSSTPYAKGVMELTTPTPRWGLALGEATPLSLSGPLEPCSPPTP